MGMKSSIKQAVARLIQIDFVWKALDATLLQLARFVEWQHTEQTRRSKGVSLEVTAIESLQSHLTVLHGPFTGLKYPENAIQRGTIGRTAYAEVNPLCGNLFPKLIGSYERELHPILNQLSGNRYTEIINVGCAEGYYVVGLALRFPDANVYAYDLVAEKRDYCVQLAKLNQCQARIQLHESCDPATLKLIPIRSRGLIVCDCEGYERELFSDEVIPHLTQSDLLIEVHDFVDLNLTEKLKQQFAETHEITTVRSIDDLEKARHYDFAELADYDLNQRFELLRENRAYLMDWLFLTPLK